MIPNSRAASKTNQTEQNDGNLNFVLKTVFPNRKGFLCYNIKYSNINQVKKYLAEVTDTI